MSSPPDQAELAALLRTGDALEIRRFGVLRGFLNGSWRRQLWPLACEVSCDDSSTTEGVKVHAQVALDVPRAMHFDCTRTWGAADRHDALSQLAEVLNAVFSEPAALCCDSEDDTPAGGAHIAPAAEAAAMSADAPHYYQGAHDICSVLLLEVGPHAAKSLMRYLVGGPGGHLRGLVRLTMAPAVAELRLLLPLLASADAAVHAALGRHLAAAGMDAPHFALPWVTTLFAHNVEALSPLGRLFDVFLCSHPLMPIYVAAALLIHCRARVLALGDDYGPAHTTLQALPRALDSMEVTESVIARAVALFSHCPPSALVEGAPADARATLRLQWPETMQRGAHTAWGAPVSVWEASMPTASPFQVAVVASVAAVAVAALVWRLRAKK